MCGRKEGRYIGFKTMVDIHHWCYRDTSASSDNICLAFICNQQSQGADKPVESIYRMCGKDLYLFI